MSKINFLRRLTYRAEIVKPIRVLGLRKIARRLYWFWTKPKNNIFTLEVGGIVGQFRIHTPEELRLFEGDILLEKKSLERFLSFVCLGDIIYDIGANIGLYTIFLAKAVGEKGQVIAFEPGSQNFDRLRENMILNKLGNVRIFKKALGHATKKAKLYGEGGRSSLISPPSERTDIDFQVVEMVRGDNFREKEDLPLPRAIKIDVEGYEYAVLQGLQRTLSLPICELCLVEVHSDLLPLGLKPEVVLSLLKS